MTKPKPPAALLVAFQLALIGEIVAVISDANLLVQLALAWSATVCADLLRDADHQRKE
jgi:hypothetical protein